MPLAGTLEAVNSQSYNAFRVSRRPEATHLSLSKRRDSPFYQSYTCLLNSNLGPRTRFHEIYSHPRMLCNFSGGIDSGHYSCYEKETPVASEIYFGAFGSRSVNEQAGYMSDLNIYDGQGYDQLWIGTQLSSFAFERSL